jgi:hypothetical protein
LTLLVTPANINLMVRNTKYPEAQAAAIGNPNSAIIFRKLISIVAPVNTIYKCQRELLLHNYYCSNHQQGLSALIWHTKSAL